MRCITSGAMDAAVNAASSRLTLTLSRESSFGRLARDVVSDAIRASRFDLVALDFALVAPFARGFLVQHDGDAQPTEASSNVQLKICLGEPDDTVCTRWF